MREQRWNISSEELYPRRFAKREGRADTEYAAGGEASVEYDVCRKIRYRPTIARYATNKARRRPKEPLKGGQVDLRKTNVYKRRAIV